MLENAPTARRLGSAPRGSLDGPATRRCGPADPAGRLHFVSAGEVQAGRAGADSGRVGSCSSAPPRSVCATPSRRPSTRGFPASSCTRPWPTPCSAGRGRRPRRPRRRRSWRWREDGRAAAVLRVGRLGMSGGGDGGAGGGRGCGLGGRFAWLLDRRAGLPGRPHSLAWPRRRGGGARELTFERRRASGNTGAANRRSG